MDDDEEHVVHGILLALYRLMSEGAFCALTVLEGVQTGMSNLYSIVFELRVRYAATISGATGPLAHALFLNLIKQFDPALSASLHDMPGPKPFTVSPLLGVEQLAENLTLPTEQVCLLRLTLLDGGDLWHRLSPHPLPPKLFHVHPAPSPLQPPPFL